MDLVDYPDDLTAADALQVYFKRYHFSNGGGYEDKIFRIKIGPVLLPFPNTKARLAAVKFHDLHHVLTGYNALWKGEVELAAWEVASGCGTYHVAWILNYGSFCLGIMLFPGALIRAFLNGRNTHRNLYSGYRYDSELLHRNLGQLRTEMGIGYDCRRSFTDVLYLVCWMTLAFAGWTTLIFLISFLF
jgi:hypothetical protein